MLPATDKRTRLAPSALDLLDNGSTDADLQVGPRGPDARGCDRDRDRLASVPVGRTGPGLQGPGGPQARASSSRDRLRICSIRPCFIAAAVSLLPWQVPAAWWPPPPWLSISSPTITLLPRSKIDLPTV